MAQKKKPTKAQIKARENEKAMRNPFTGQPPNSFTQVTNRELPEPKNVRENDRDRGLQVRSRRAAHEWLTGHDGDAPMGYRYDMIGGVRAPITDEKEATEFLKRNPGSIQTVQDVQQHEPDQTPGQYRTFVQGGRHILPNTAAERGTPAINEPHEAHPGVTVQRRAEDLSGKEVRKGLSTLIQYGHDPKDPMESLREVHRRALDHAMAQHIVNGVEESSSQMFYGGTPTTDISEHDMAAQEAHENGVMAAHDRFAEATRNLAMHPDFKAQTAHLTHRQRMDAATNLMAQATSDTSPNTKWRDKKSDGSPAKYPWPNVQQGEEAATASVEQREPQFISGRIGNVYKAANRVSEAIDTKNYDVHQYGDPVAAAKTVAFRGALVDKDSPDAFEVSDVHDASRHVAPWLDTAKAHMHAHLDDEGNQVGHKVSVYEDTPKDKRRGLTMLTKTQMREGRSVEVPQWGLSRPEAMLAEGRSTVHALNDLASRQVLAERGLSRGPNYADNVHPGQAMVWGVQQLHRSDVNVSPADQYPVARSWEHEGFNVPENHDIRNLPHSASTNLSPQFGKNDRTGRTQTVWPEDH